MLIRLTNQDDFSDVFIRVREHAAVVAEMAMSPDFQGG